MNGCNYLLMYISINYPKSGYKYTNYSAIIAIFANKIKCI